MGQIFIGLADNGERQYLELSRANRHGLVAGATGTGKTVTLQTMVEGFSRAGVPSFVADVKGDLSGLGLAGSALAYSGASLPLTGAGLFARVWSQILPLTHFMALQMDQVMGVAAMPFLRAGAVLMLYPLVAGGAGAWLIRRAGRRA